MRFGGMIKMKIAIGADHAGFEFKEQLKEYISSLGYDVKDFGAHSFNKDDGFPDEENCC